MNHHPSPIFKISVLGTRGFPHIQGGVEAHCEHLYPHLVEKGCEVTVFTRKPYVDLSVTEYKGVRLIPLPCLKNKFLEAFLHTFTGIFAAKKISPDILHIHAIGPSLFIPLARLLGLKVIMTHHGPDYERKKWGRTAKGILKLGEKLGCKWANGIICISKSIAKEVQEKYNRDVTIIPNGVTIPENTQKEDALGKYGLEKGKYLLAVGRFVPEKGFHDLLDAFNLFQLETQNSKPEIRNTKSETRNPKLEIQSSKPKARNPKLETRNTKPETPWKLVIVGRADHEDKYSLDLKEKAAKNNDIILTGFLTGEPLRELYRHAGLFVLPSYYEGLPIVLLEAMSYGLSCIASDIPANRNVELSENRFFRAGDTKGLNAKIREFTAVPLSEEERRSQTDMIAERYNWERIAEETRKVYECVIGASQK